MTDSFYRKNMYLFLIIRLIAVIVVFTIVNNSRPIKCKDGSPFNKIDIINETINLLTNNISPWEHRHRSRCVCLTWWILCGQAPLTTRSPVYSRKSSREYVISGKDETFFFCELTLWFSLK